MVTIQRRIETGIAYARCLYELEDDDKGSFYRVLSAAEADRFCPHNMRFAVEILGRQDESALPRRSLLPKHGSIHDLWGAVNGGRMEEARDLLPMVLTDIRERLAEAEDRCGDDDIAFEGLDYPDEVELEAMLYEAWDDIVVEIEGGSPAAARTALESILFPVDPVCLALKAEALGLKRGC